MPFDPNQPYEVVARGFDPSQPYEDLGNVHDSVIVRSGPEDNLERAARDWQALQGGPFDPLRTQAQTPSPSVAAPLGKGLQVLGRALYGGLASLGQDVTGQTMREAEAARMVPGYEEAPGNIEALVKGEAMPAETDLRALSTGPRVVAEAARGLVESTPQLAAVAGLQALGVPAPVAAATIFGSTPEGFDPQAAAVALALPYAGRYMGELTGAVAKQMGVTTSEAMNLIKGIGGVTGAAGYLAVINESEIAKLPPEQRQEARLQAWAGLIGQAALGPMGVEFERPTGPEVVGRFLEQQVKRSEPNLMRANLGAARVARAEGIEGPEWRATAPAVEEAAALGGEPQREWAAGLSPEARSDFERAFQRAEMETAARRAADEALRQPKPPVEPKPELARVAGSKFRPEVPGTPAEPYQTVLQEIRAREARTTRQVQALFPKAQLSRQQAAALRRMAWDEGDGGGGGISDLRSQISEPETPSAAKAVEPPAPNMPEPQGAGSGFTVSTPVEGVPVSGHWDVVDAADLVTSFDAGYDQSLQPRDRTRQAARQQVAQIASRLDPSRLGESATSDLGAPMVDARNQVLSGNGRTAAIRALYASGRDRAYRDWLLRNAEDHGVDPDRIARTARPVLVRRVTDFGELTAGEFARQSNQQQVAGMSEAEKAAGDARTVRNNAGLLNAFRPSEEGDLLAASNREFLNSFIQATGDQAELLLGDGSYNAGALTRRVKNAVLGALLGDNHEMLRQLVEGAEALGMKHAVTGTMNAAPRLIRFAGTAWDLAPVLQQAFKDLASMRAQGMKLEDYLGTKPLFADPGRTYGTDLVLSHLAQAKSAKAVAEGLARYAELARNALEDAQSGGMMGLQPQTRQELVKGIYGRPEAKGPAQEDLSLGKPPRSPEPGAGAGAAGAGAGAGAGAEGGAPAGGERKPTILTNEDAAAALKRMRERLGRASSLPGPLLDPGLYKDAVIIAGNIVERGYIKYSEFVRQMARELGELAAQLRPYFKQWYNQVRDYTELHGLKGQMTPREEVEKYEAEEAAKLGAAAGAGGQPELSGAVGGGGRSGRPGIRVVDEGDLPPARSIVRAGQYQGPAGHAIDETQRLAINQALTLFEGGGDAFLLGDGTGVGKTGTELVIAAETAKRTGLPSLIVTQNRGIISNRFQVDAAKFGVPAEQIEFATFDDLSRGNVPSKKYGVVIFDEAHNLKNANSARSWRSGLIEAQHKVFATATPMDTPMHAAYFLAQLTGKTREQIGKMLGYKFVTRVVGGQEREFVQLEPGMTWGQVTDNIKSLRNDSVKRGALIRREYPFYGQANFRNARPLDGIAKEEQERIIDYWDKRIEGAYSPTARRNLSGQKTGELSRWVEIQKLPEVLEDVLGDLKAGRKVIVFAEGFNRTLIKGLEKEVPGFLAEFAKELEKRGIKYLKVFEDSPEKKARAAAAFQRGEADVLLATPRSGGAGIDMDDIVGDAARTAHFVTMNFSGDVFDQMLGRVSRRNTASPAQVKIWRQQMAFADRRRQLVLDAKLLVLRNIQAGQDLDVNRFVEQAKSEETGGPGAGAESLPLEEDGHVAFLRRELEQAESAGERARIAGELAVLEGQEPRAEDLAARYQLLLQAHAAAPSGTLLEELRFIEGQWEGMRRAAPDLPPLSSQGQGGKVAYKSTGEGISGKLPGQSDYERFRELKADVEALLAAAREQPGRMDELVAQSFQMRAEMEEIKNRHGGFPPEPEVAAAEPLNPATAAANRAALNLRVQQQQAAGGPVAAQALAQATSGSARWFYGLRAAAAPLTLDESASVMGGVLRYAMGREYSQMRQADFALRHFRQEFDRTPVPRNWTYVAGEALPRNYEVMRAIDTGAMGSLTPLEQEFAWTMRRLFDQAIATVQEVSPESLRDLIENYFPRIWREPQKNRAVINRLLARRPWEGPKSFLKKRVLEYFTEGLTMGLRPVADNPVEVTLAKLGEMYRFAATRHAMEEAKALGLRKFVYIYEQAPEGWREVNDPSSKVWAPPVVTVKEAFDAQQRAKTLELLDWLGIDHKRLVNIGGRRWGYAQQGGGIVTKFAGPDAVIWHEMGHQVDWKYPDLRGVLGANSPNSALGRELAALADLRYEGSAVSAGYQRYVRERVEKMANVFDAYLRAPKRFAEVAPRVLEAFKGWLDLHPDFRDRLNDVQPSLTLGVGTAEQFLGGPVLLGRWMMPEGAAQVVTNYLQPGLGSSGTFRTLRQAASLLNGVQLAGFFHGQFVLNDSFYSGFGLALYDVLNGRPARGLKELALTPISPFTSLYRGGQIKRAIENPAGASAWAKQMANLAVTQNLRAGHGNYDPEFWRHWVRAVREFKTMPSAGAAWETLWRAPFAGLELAMKPVMAFLVPRMKLGIFARMAERVIADNPEADTLTLRKLLAHAADATEDRLGQVTYDNLFQNRTLKDAGQLAFRAYGWQLTKYRMIGGGSADWVRAGAALLRGEKPQATFRMTYLPAMVLGHAVLGATIQYMLTGKGPAELKDYLFPKTGERDQYGNEVRVAIADFVKDIVADWRAFPDPVKMGAEWTRKLSPLWSVLAEMVRNQDFWGTEIFSSKKLGEPALEHLMRNLQEMSEHLGKAALPFSVTAARRFHQQGASSAGATLAPFFGIIPAPRYAVQTPAELLSAEITRRGMPAAGRTREQGAHAQAIGELVRELRTGQINDRGELATAARAAGVRNQAELTRIKQRVLWTPLQYQVSKMPVKDAMEVFDVANEQQRLSLTPFLMDKIERAYAGGTLDEESTQHYVRVLRPYAQRARSQGLRVPGKR